MTDVVIKYKAEDILEALQKQQCAEPYVDPQGAVTRDAVVYKCRFQNGSTGDKAVDADCGRQVLIEFCRTLRLPPRILERVKVKRFRDGVILTTLEVHIPLMCAHVP